MSDKRWTPRALDRAQVDSITIANTWAAADTQTSTINEKDLVLTVGATVTTTSIATAVKEMINGDDETTNATRSETGDNVPEFQLDVGATVSGSVVTLTGKTKGRPFVLTSTENTAGSGTATLASVTTATGLNFFDNVDNWGGSAIPADADNVFFDNSDVSVLYGLSNPNIEPAAVYVSMSFTGEIGLPEIDDEGQYNQYRPTYFRIGPPILQVGAGGGAGSGRLKFDSGDDVCALSVLNSGASADDLPAVIWKGTHASNTLTMRGGSLGIAVFGGETATLASFTVHDGDLMLGAGVTLSGALVVNGGTVRINSKVDGSLTTNGGEVLIDGTAEVDQLTMRGGTVVYNSSGTLGGNTVLSGGAVLDLSQDSRPLAGVTNPIDMYGTECRIIDPYKRLGNVVIDFNEGASPTQVEFGQNLRLTRGATA
jgi:hypothetical protein